MPSGPQRFKRIVLGLQQPRERDLAMRLAADLARLLNIELLGMFLEDTSLQNLAGMPFARELRPLGGGWHPLDLGDMSRTLEFASRSAERMFAETAGRLQVHCRFEIAREPAAAAFATLLQTSDIVVIGEPASAAERVTQQFTWLIQAAFHSAAAVLVVPGQVAQVSGPIVALATAPDDASIAVAANLVRAAGEELVVVQVGKTATDEEKMRALADARHSGRPLQERLVVTARGASDGRAASLIAAERRVPVLVLESAELAGAERGG
jgi:hypothetical protein